MHILVAIDGSAPSLRAARQAIALSLATHGSVTLVHVIPLAGFIPEVPVDVTPLLEESQRAGEQLLSDTAKELSIPNAARVCLRGSYAEAIADYAEQHHVDLVAIGSKGRGAVSRVLLGSTTDRLVHICRQPVLVVR